MSKPGCLKKKGNAPISTRHRPSWIRLAINVSDGETILEKHIDELDYTTKQESNVEFWVRMNKGREL